MDKKSVKRLKDIGVLIHNVSYSYPDEDWLKDIGFWNHENWEKEIEFSIQGRVESAEDARLIEECLLILVKAKKSKNKAVLEMIKELETLLGLTK